MIDERDKAVVDSVLHEREKLIWTGKPQRLAWFAILSALAFFTAFFWAFPIQLGVALLNNEPSNVNMTINETKVTANTPMSTIKTTFWITSLLIVGLALASIYFIRSRMKELYAVTNVGGIIIRPTFPFHVVRIRVDAFDYLTRSGGNDFGTLAFGHMDNHPFRHLIRNFNYARTKFHNISNPFEVEKLIFKQFPKLNPEPHHE